MPDRLDLFAGIAVEEFGELAAAFGVEIDRHFGGWIDRDWIHQPSMKEWTQQALAGIRQVHAGTFNNHRGGGVFDRVAGHAGESARGGNELRTNRYEFRIGRGFGGCVCRVTMKRGASRVS